MQPVPNSPIRLDRRHPVARQIIASWRSLLTQHEGDAAGEPTLIACSGGADSVALALALASTGSTPVLAFAKHDARSIAEVEADLSIVRTVAEAIGGECVALDCPSKTGQVPNEALMRRSRYAALAAEARRRSIRFVATGHHADDQLETVLLALIRGSGLTGMAGMAPSRPLDADSPTVLLLRPMLGVTRADAERLCLDAGFSRPGNGGLSWAVDHTNTDTAYFRNRVRHEVVPMLDALNPGLAERVSVNAEWFRQASSLIRSQAIELDRGARESASGGAIRWSRPPLSTVEPVVLGDLIRWSVETRLGRQGLDRLTGETLRAITEAIRDRSTDPRRFEPGAGLVIEVTAHSVTLTQKNPA
ncbi:MAG: tRNA lysidine(34) synthetase TilS [Phycisphaerales bacterium JB065]